MIRGQIVAVALMCFLAGPLGASMAGANPAAALFASPLRTGQALWMAPDNPISRSASTFLTSAALIPDLEPYAAPFTGSADLLALLEISQ